MPRARSFAELDTDFYERVLARVHQDERARRPSPERIRRIARVVTRRLRSVTVVFDNLWHRHNRAAVLRTAEGLGIADVHVVDGECDEPEDRPKDGLSRAITRGAEQWIDIQRHAAVEVAFPTLRSRGFLVCAADVGDGCVPVTEIVCEQPVAVVLGNEKFGLSDEARRAADVRFSIPMAGFTGSFNVSVSAAIALWEVCQRRRAFLGRSGDLDVESATQLAVRWLERTGHDESRA